MITYFKNIFSKVTKEKIIVYIVAITCISMFSVSSAILHKTCGINATLPLICIVFSMLLAVKYFIVDSMQKDFQKYLYDFIEDYPKKVGEIYRQEYINRQNGLLEELENTLKKNKETK